MSDLTRHDTQCPWGSDCGVRDEHAAEIATPHPAKTLLSEILAIVNHHQGRNAEQAMAEIEAACLASIDRPATADGEDRYAGYDARCRAEVIALISRQAKRIGELEAAQPQSRREGRPVRPPAPPNLPATPPEDPMTDTAPDAAVQIAADAICYPLGADGNARAVVAALARAGWLTPPAEVAALRAVADAARAHREMPSPGQRFTWDLVRARQDALDAALDALPPADGAR